MYARHLVAANAGYGQLLGLEFRRRHLGAVGLMLEAFHPLRLTLQVGNDILGQRDGSARGSIELMHMVRFLHLDVVLWKTVHDTGKIAVHGTEDGHTNREVACPEQRMLTIARKCLNIGFMILHPTRGPTHHLHVMTKGAQVIAVGSRRIGELYGHIGTGKLG